MGHTFEFVLLVGLLGALVWNIQGKSCLNKAECQPNITCHIVPWSCNGSDYTPGTTPGPTETPSNTKCCEHLGTCGGETEVAGWVSVRSTNIELDSVPYNAEWLDTFVTEGNSSEPSVIKSAYVGSWSTLKQDGFAFPSQMFVAEPTNSCTVDGEPKWPEWYQVTVNVVSDDNQDDTLDVDSQRSKDCLCDVAWDCKESLCWVETQNVSNGGDDLSKTNASLEFNVGRFCRSPVSIVNYTASSYFALGFWPEQAEIDSFNFNTSVEGGWGPELDDTDIWFQVNLEEDTIISGIVTQGVAVNPERRVDKFTIKYMDSDDTDLKDLSPYTEFVAGARLDTKMTNHLVTPIKANVLQLQILTPCDPYYVGLRLELLGCPPCSVDGDCTEFDNGLCEPEKFCSYEVLTTTAADTTTVARVATTEEGTTAKDGLTTASATTPPNAPPQTTTQSPGTSTPPNSRSTMSPASLKIEKKINELTNAVNLPQEEKKVLEDLLLNVDLTSSAVIDDYPVENITSDVIRVGLDVIRNITTDANSTQNNELQVQIIKSAWNFLVVVSKSNKFVNESGSVDINLLKEYLVVSSLILDEDRADAWNQVQKESVVGPVGIVASVENVFMQVAKQTPGNINLTFTEENIEGVMLGQSKKTFVDVGFKHTFRNSNPDQEATQVFIDKGSFANHQKVKNLPAYNSLKVIVLKFSSIEKVLDNDDVEDNTPEPDGPKRVGSDILSVSVVGSDVYPLPLTFKLGHSNPHEGENPECSFWESEGKISGQWSADGCKTTELSKRSTNCSCNHMTNYAILMWLGPEDNVPNHALEVISTVGCLVSISALALALALLLYLRSSLSSERIIIHMHLMSVTLVAMVIFVAGADKTDNPLLCQFITIALHFFYMSMFSWMLVEGIHLYRQIIAVFESGKSRLWVYFAIGWGIPIIVVGITSGIFFNKYKDHKFCWLDVEDGSIWAFTGPIIPVILVNFVVLIMVSRIVMSAAKLQKEKPAFNSAKAGLRSSLLLLPILGVTWIFGYFIHFDVSLQFIYVILNAFQGFFMALFHCFMSSEVNSALKQKIRRVKESSLGGASTIDSSNKPAMFTSGIRKVKVCPSQTDNTDGY